MVMDRFEFSKLNLGSSATGRNPHCRKLLECIQEHGIAIFQFAFANPELFEELLHELNIFYARSLEEKQRYERPEIGRQRGYTSPRTEHALGQSPDSADLKEFWQEGPPEWEGLGLCPNVITDSPRLDLLRRLAYEEIRKRVMQFLRAIADLLNVPPEWLVRYASDGDTIMRLLRYFALRGQVFPPGTLRSAPHTDINLVTALLTRGKGLVLKSKTGERVEIDVGPNELVFQMGEMIEVLSGGLLPATLHWVENPDDVDTTRDSIAMFNHPAPLQWIDVLPHLRRPSFIWDPGTERAVTEKRLIEIGVLQGPPKFAHEFASKGFVFPSPWPGF